MSQLRLSKSRRSQRPTSIHSFVLIKTSQQVCGAFVLKNHVDVPEWWSSCGTVGREVTLDIRGSGFGSSL